MKTESELDTLCSKIQAHTRFVAPPGRFDQEGIERRVRQGSGGSSEIVVGANVTGHYDSDDGSWPNMNEEIITYHDGKKVVVRLNQRASRDVYDQSEEDEVGFSFDGEVIKIH